MVILFKEQPLEIWDMKSFSIIKKISKKSPNITILEWCPYDFYSNVNRNKKLEIKHEIVDLAKSIAESLEGDSTEKREMKSSKSLQTFSNSPSEHSTVLESRESFICIDQNGLMYSFSVESNQIKDSSIPLPEDGVINNVTCMSLKKDYIIYGDQDGNVIRWNYINKLSKTLPLKRGGEVKKIKFAPGKENLLFLVQYADCLEILEATSLDIVSSYKCANNKVKLMDSYWSSSDRVLIQFSDGQIRLFDFNLKPMPANFTNSLPSLFNNTIMLKRSVLVAFKNLLLELVDCQLEPSSENMQNLSSKLLILLISFKILFT